MNVGPSGLKAINQRMKRGMPIPAAMLQKLIDNDRTLGGKLAARPKPVVPQRPVRFNVSFDTTNKRIYVGIGRAATAENPEDRFIRPMMPTMDGDPLDAEERPFFDYTDFENAAHEIVCAINNERAQIQVWKDGEVVAGFQGGSGEEEDNDDGRFFLIATVSFNEDSGTKMPADFVQVWASDITWPMEEESSSSSGSSGDDSSDDSSGPSDGSSKDSAIVPAAWSPSGYAALYTVEAPDVRFTDTMRARLSRRVTRLELDPRYVAACEPGSIQVVALTPSKPMALGGRIEGSAAIITRSIWSGPCEATVYVSGIRKGFLGCRFGIKTRKQFEKNERRLKGI